MTAEPVVEMQLMIPHSHISCIILKHSVLDLGGHVMTFAFVF